MQHTAIKHNSGFTLVELMLAVTISIFLIGGVVLIQSSSRAASIEAERVSRIQENVRFNSDFLVREMRNAGFRDQLSLTIKQFNRIGDIETYSGFASVNDIGNEVTIKYSGRGSCTDPFNAGGILEAGIVTNKYYVAGDELRCEGIFENADGTRRGDEALASGIEDIRFELMCPSGGCTSCPLWVNGDDFDDEQAILNDTCYGIRIGLLLEPVGPDADPVPVELSAAFRNIVLGKLMWDAI